MKIEAQGDSFTAVEPHVDALLEMDRPDRDTYLAGLDADQPRLAAVLRDLLATRDELEEKGFLENSVGGFVDDALIGAEIGAYTVQSLIGRGGMGEVWLALRSDGRFEGKFAIKFLDTYSASPAALARFRREGRLLARLTHPHIARLIDAGVTTNGRPYLVLEYVEGERIDGYCQANSLGVEARIRLLLDVLGALAHAHGNLIIHRDIKPSNVLVTAAGATKLLDFGIAKLLGNETDGGLDSQHTRLEDSALTPDFAAPEQFLGEPATTATDVYQFGVLMFVLLARRLPLSSMGSTRLERIKNALEVEAPRLSEVAPEGLRKELRGDIDAIVAKALRKIPQERYVTAAALAEDLQRYLDSEPVLARANLFGYRLQKFVRRYRAAVTGTAVAALALVAVAAFALYQMREAQIQRDQSHAQAKRAELQAEFVTLMMSTVGDKPTTAEQLFDAGMKLLDSRYTADPLFRATAMLELASNYSDVGATKKELGVLEKADDIARQQDNQALVARVQCSMSGVSIDLGKMEDAVSHLAAGHAALARVDNPDPLYVEECVEADANLANAQGRSVEATQIAQRAIATLEQLGETHDMHYFNLLARMGDYYKAAGDTHKGFDFVVRALGAVEADGLGDTDTSTIFEHNIAAALIRFGEVNEACAREGTLIARLQSSGRTIIAAMTALYGKCFQWKDQYPEALSWNDQSLHAAETENEVGLLMNAQVGRARAFLSMNRLAESKAALDRVADLTKQDVPLGNIPKYASFIVRAEWLLAEGRPEEARRELQPALQAAGAPQSSLRTLLGSSLMTAFKIAMAQHRFSDALASANQALEEEKLRSRDPDKSADVGEAALYVAQASRALGDTEAARRAAQQALVSLTTSLGADNYRARAAAALVAGDVN